MYQLGDKRFGHYSTFIGDEGILCPIESNQRDGSLWIASPRWFYGWTRDYPDRGHFVSQFASSQATRFAIEPPLDIPST